ncbi:MAG: methanogenesis marker protein Mmp4/MtxX [Candidatus Lokiarchaeota archaeon]|nr:methanogenesis marker protein Mmp4/MtxX [Candidatus Lokiarchaeota archaeon]
MSLIHEFELMSKGKTANIGIGLGTSELHNQKILKASFDFLRERSSKIYIFGNKHAILNINKQKSYMNSNSNIKFVECEEAEKEIFESLNNNMIDAIIRGSLSSNKFLKNLRNLLNIQKINRLALLETVNGHQFFYGPVGIDECNNLVDKLEFIEQSLKEFELLNIKPNISILSGGRLGDIGRDEKIDKSIRDGEKIVEIIKKKYPTLSINHHEILIEDAVRNKANLILAPEGISGNLIYRTLVHLGGGKAYGAIYMGLKKAIIDTSRVGDISEIHGAFLLALALT